MKKALALFLFLLLAAAALAIVGRGPPAYSSTKWMAEIDGIAGPSYFVVEDGVNTLSGVGAEVNVIDNWNPSQQLYNKAAGQAKAFNVVFTVDRDDYDLSEFRDWKTAVDAEGAAQHRNMSIILLNEELEPAIRYNYRKARPVLLRDTTKNGHNVTEIHLQVDSVERVNA